MTLLVAGAGCVATALANALENEGIEVARWSRSGRPHSGARDVVIVAVTDSAISEVAARLVAEGFVGYSTVLLHCAGALPAEEVFSSLRTHVKGVGLLHPLRALVGADEDQDLAGTVFGVEGDDAGIQVATDLVRRVGGQPLVLTAEGLARYHAAAALAGNHTLALVATGMALLVGEGLDSGAAAAALGGLLASAARNVVARGLPAALTGPIVRGDIAVVARHLAALPEPELSIYRASARPTVDLARRSGRTSIEALTAIDALLAPHRN